MVPQAAIQRDANSAYAMVVGKDGNVVRKNVVTSGQRAGNWLVTSGLAAGDQVIAAGLQKVREGAPAKATPWKAEAAPGAGPATAPAPAASEDKAAPAADPKGTQPDAQQN